MLFRSVPSPLPATMTKLPLAILFASSLLALLAPAASAQFDFDPAVAYPSARNAIGITEADLNHDGVPDLLVSAGCPSRLICLFNDCTGNFYFAGDLILPLGARPGDVFASDFDGDGDDDLAVVEMHLDQIEIYANQGAGTFVLGATLPTGHTPRGMSMADYDGDGDMDLAVADEGADDAMIFENQAGTFVALAPLPLPMGAMPQEVAFGDFDGDGDADLAVSAIGSRDVSVYTNNAGAFALSQTVAMNHNLIPRGMDAVDLDNDGLDDLAVTSNNWTGAFLSILMSSAGTLGTPVESATGGAGECEVRGGDFDNDGLVDLAVTNSWTDDVSLFQNLGGGLLGAPQRELAGDHPCNLAMEDFDANGRLDFAVANAGTEATVHLNRTDDLLVAQTGTCPGTLTWTISGATPNGTIVCLIADGCGRFVIPAGNPCAGTVTGLDSTARVVNVSTADPQGNAVISQNVGAGACGKPVQLLDLTTCKISNVVLL